MTHRLFTGESRLIEFSISDTRHESITISSAYYRVLQGDTLVDSGIMDVDSDTNVISFRFNPDTAGVYRVVIQYTIGLDTMKDKYDIEVVDADL